MDYQIIDRPNPRSTIYRTFFKGTVNLNTVPLRSVTEEGHHCIESIAYIELSPKGIRTLKGLEFASFDPALPSDEIEAVYAATHQKAELMLADYLTNNHPHIVGGIKQALHDYWRRK